MENSLRQKIISSNKSIWQKEKYSGIAKKGLYEIYFIIIYNRERKEAFWIRYTLVCFKKDKSTITNTEDSSSGSGLLWFAYFNADQPVNNFICKKHFPLSEVIGTFTDETEITFLKIKNSILSLDKMVGEFTTKTGMKISWNLTFSKFQKPYIVVPKVAKILAISNTINNATHPHFEVTGSIDFNKERRSITSSPAIQYHTYADEYKLPWEWFNCYTFENVPFGYLDFSYKLNKGILEFNDGKRQITSWNRNFITKLLTGKKLKRKHTTYSLSFKLNTRNVTISGEVSVDEKKIIGVEYFGPKGEKFYCYNSELATCNLEIFKRNKVTKNFEKKEYTAHESVAFETTYKKPLDGLEYFRWEEEEFYNS